MQTNNILYRQEDDQWYEMEKPYLNSILYPIVGYLLFGLIGYLLVLTFFSIGYLWLSIKNQEDELIIKKSLTFSAIAVVEAVLLVMFYLYN